MKTPFLKALLGVAAASTLFLAACGDDGSNPNSPDSQSSTELSSSDAGGPVLPGSSSDVGPVPVESSSSAEPPVSQSVDGGSSSSEGGEPVVDQSSASQQTGHVFADITAEDIAKDQEFVKQSAITGFTSVKEVYENLAADEKVVFVIRHGKRESGTGVESKLTAAGVEQAQRLGSYLVSEEEFSYGHTDFVRTRATAENIAIGRGETGEFKSIITPDLVASIYVKDEAKFDQYKADSTESSNEGQVYSKWAFDGSFQDAFNDLNTRAVQAITQAIIPNMSETNRVNIFISHDMFLLPLMTYCSDRKVEQLRYHVSRKGIYYLSGVAIVVKSNGDRRYYLVEGVEWGT